MSEIVWMTVLGKRVAPVPSDMLCNNGEVECIFKNDNCGVLKNGRHRAACNVFATADSMFITEDQLLAYLATRLTGEA